MYHSAHIVFTGSCHNMCAYFSKGGKCIIRSRSSLTGDHVARDPAFAGFRQSGNRMKEASPIAAALYRLISKEQKEYSLYRTLTGETLNMIKQGIDKETIIRRLTALYIDPVLQGRVKKKTTPRDEGISCNDRHTHGSGRRANISDMRSFIRYPVYRTVKKRQRVRQYADGHSREMEQINEAALKQAACSRVKFSTLLIPPGPIYLGREKKFKKFAMWLIPDTAFTITDMRKITEALIFKA